MDGPLILSRPELIRRWIVSEPDARHHLCPLRLLLPAYVTIGHLHVQGIVTHDSG